MKKNYLPLENFVREKVTQKNEPTKEVPNHSQNNEPTKEAPFNKLFPIDPMMLQTIQEYIQKHGYDHSQPIIVWKERGAIVDGNTRFVAARNVGIQDVPIIYKSFADEDEALEYAIHNQRDRRNISDADLMRCIELDPNQANI